MQKQKIIACILIGLLAKPTLGNSLTEGQMEYAFGKDYKGVQAEHMTTHEMQTTEADGWIIDIIKWIVLAIISWKTDKSIFVETDFDIDNYNNNGPIQNTMNHIFGRKSIKKHNLKKVIDAFGSKERAFHEIQNAAERLAHTRGYDGKFETHLDVGRERVTIRGRVMNGRPRIATAYIEKKH